MSAYQRPSRRWSRMAAAVAGCLLAAGLAGCTGSAPELQADAAAQLQQRVLEVTKAAAGSDPAVALKSLDRLSSELDAAAAAGQVSFKRHQSISGAIDSVRADLTAAQAAKKAAAASAAKAAAAKAAAAEAAKQAPAPAVVAPAPVTGGKKDNAGKGSSDGNKGPGKNKG
ncbi:mucin-associated surface protein [Arthrobacter sp. NPDC056493]|uniref:mucin-associated surface protein n=1 Tax=Arthrobacter sp. NPDC056493 TaxID=3345839 RepID=UPI00366B2F9A